MRHRRSVRCVCIGPRAGAYAARRLPFRVDFLSALVATWAATSTFTRPKVPSDIANTSRGREPMSVRIPIVTTVGEDFFSNAARPPSILRMDTIHHSGV